MRSRTAEWFEVKVRYEKIQEDGLTKPTTELYVVDAFTFTEAESSITEEMSSYISGEFTIKDMKKAPYNEIFFSSVGSDDRWFRVKLFFITIDEKTAKEKRSPATYLVQASTLPTAVKYIEEVMGSALSEYTIGAVQETMILDVFEHDAVREHLTNIHDGNADDDIVEYEQNQQNAE